MAEDPVCGMEVDEATDYKSEHMGETYYFCSPMCKATFEKKPMKYIRSEGHSDHSNHGCGCC